MIGKWLARDPRVLILDEPTRRHRRPGQGPDLPHPGTARRGRRWRSSSSPPSSRRCWSCPTASLTMAPGPHRARESSGGRPASPRFCLGAARLRSTPHGTDAATDDRRRAALAPPLAGPTPACCSSRRLRDAVRRPELRRPELRLGAATSSTSCAQISMHRHHRRRHDRGDHRRPRSTCRSGSVAALAGCIVAWLPGGALVGAAAAARRRIAGAVRSARLAGVVTASSRVLFRIPTFITSLALLTALRSGGLPGQRRLSARPYAAGLRVPRRRRLGSASPSRSTSSLLTFAGRRLP